MPELPEVETLARRLDPLLQGQQIQSVQVLHPKSFVGAESSVVGATVVSVSRKAKVLKIALSNDCTILVHLKMSGQLIWVHGAERVGGGHPTADWVSSLPSTHTRVIFAFAGGGTLFFNDQRIFGWCKVVPSESVASELSVYGPDITDPTLTVMQFASLYQSKQRSIKLLILDGHLVAGIGNIYACDGLHLANISPFKAGNELTSTELNRLFTALKVVIALGIKTGGASMTHFAHVDGFSGTYQEVRRVYMREGEPCGECGTKIVRVKQGGRSTFYCPHCQV